MRQEEQHPRQHASKSCETALATREEPLVLQTSRPAENGKTSSDVKDHSDKAKHREGELLTKDPRG